ncbi:MAG TPA: TrbG/VirB9 family P-type conjugative transfer protein [Steroidobacteraceae bacterium]|nr:TrbG/VirB9 family P-type conjugative transfer protein [Steroidobacteraceae bacterium]
MSTHPQRPRHCAASFLASLALIALGAGRAGAEVYPSRSDGDPRVRTALYDADQVYRIHGFVGYEIDIEFQAGESFVGLAAGDIEGLSFVARDNHLFLKPRVASVGTNITVLTTRRHYQFDYTATARRPDPQDPELLYTVRFLYPVPAQASVQAARALIENRLAAANAARAQNLDYWYCGAPELRPVAASDDGVHTRLRFSAHAELPALFVRNDDGSESLINFNMEGEDVIIHRVARRFVLRRGALTGCIVNKGYTGTGERLTSGTVSRDVERVRREPSP